MYIYMGQMKFEHTQPYEPDFWKKNKIDLIQKNVDQVNTDQKELIFFDGTTMNYDILVLAVGSKPNKFGWPGEDLDAVQGLYHYQDLVSMEKYSSDTKKAVIVGGGLIGIEMTEMLMSRGIEVTLLVRESSFLNIIIPPEESEMINKHVREHHVDLRLNTELKEILPDETGRARAVVTTSGEEIPCQFVGLAIGVKPNVEFLRNSNIETNLGIKVNRYLETNIPDVYAIGDCAEFSNPFPNGKPLDQVWYTGRIMGVALANTICGKRTPYEPSVWFNSAKFMDIEYQTYGVVSNQLKSNEKTVYWQHPDHKKCIRINYNADNGAVLGVNVLGIRHRHEVWESWIANNVHIEEVLQNLSIANFDPEFFKQHENDVLKVYNDQEGKSIQPKRKKGIKTMIDYFVK